MAALSVLGRIASGTARRVVKVVPFGRDQARVRIAHHSCDGFAFVRAWTVEQAGGRKRAVEVDPRAAFAGPAASLEAASLDPSVGEAPGWLSRASTASAEGDGGPRPGSLGGSPDRSGRAAAAHSLSDP